LFRRNDYSGLFLQCHAAQRALLELATLVFPMVYHSLQNFSHLDLLLLQLLQRVVLHSANERREGVVEREKHK
jgi:hypothetical protein